uniref:Uncharacterized protein n=1 Tax=Glossina pallidipes TaxID=7398 RepID=A0A1A9ZTN3_GLOPL
MCTSWLNNLLAKDVNSDTTKLSECTILGNQINHKFERPCIVIVVWLAVVYGNVVTMITAPNPQFAVKVESATFLEVLFTNLWPTRFALNSIPAVLALHYLKYLMPFRGVVLPSGDINKND